MVRSFKHLLYETNELVRIVSVGRLVHPVLFDVFGFCGGFHGCWLDQEHAGLTYEQIVLASACARANGMDNFVRMALTGYSQATQNLEAGAGGLMGARVESAAQAEEFVKWCKFAPRGMRGLNAGGFDAKYGGKTLAQFAVDANRDSFTAIQIETLGALEQADEIAAIDGVDLLFVGPSDLSMELGVLGQYESEKLWNAYQRVADACRKHGKHWATIGVNPKFTGRAVDLGCRMFSFAMDAAVLRRGVETTKTIFADYFK